MLRRLAPVLALLSLPPAAGAHGLSAETQRRGEAWAVRVRYEGGPPLAGAAYQVIRPGAPERKVREGKTDDQGWAEFVPDVPGRWRVRIVDATGHGLVVDVDVAREPGPPPARAAGGR